MLLTVVPPPTLTIVGGDFEFPVDTDKTVTAQISGGDEGNYHVHWRYAGPNAAISLTDIGESYAVKATGTKGTKGKEQTPYIYAQLYSGSYCGHITNTTCTSGNKVGEEVSVISHVTTPDDPSEGDLPYQGKNNKLQWVAPGPLTLLNQGNEDNDGYYLNRIDTPLDGTQEIFFWVRGEGQTHNASTSALKTAGQYIKITDRSEQQVFFSGSDMMHMKKIGQSETIMEALGIFFLQMF